MGVMADFRTKSIATAYIVAVIAAGSMLGLHVALDKSIPADVIDNSKQTLPSPESVRLCSLGYDRFLSDLYWLGFIQYLGEMRPKGKGFVSAYNYVDLITELDPYFVKAYWFGCWAIGDWQQRPDLADKIMQRGMSYNPRDWFLPFIAGVNQNIFGHDYRKAAAYYRRAAKLPGAPDYLEHQAMILDSPIPEIVKQWQTLNRLYEQTTDDDLKQSVRSQLVGVLLRMYREAPTQTIRDSAAARLHNFGVEVQRR
jgi:hypothetical protein